MFLKHCPTIRLWRDPGGDHISCRDALCKLMLGGRKRTTGGIRHNSRFSNIHVPIRDRWATQPIPKEISNGVVHGARLADTGPPRVSLLVCTTNQIIRPLYHDLYLEEQGSAQNFEGLDAIPYYASIGGRGFACLFTSFECFFGTSSFCHKDTACAYF